jgi:hypothetical protein
MDVNKRKKLFGEGYRIYRACGLCAHGHFQDGSDWGTCSVLRYDHQNHDGSICISIHKLGKCRAYFQTDKTKLAKLEEFVEFLRE